MRDFLVWVLKNPMAVRGDWTATRQKPQVGLQYNYIHSVQFSTMQHYAIQYNPIQSNWMLQNCIQSTLTQTQ